MSAFVDKFRDVAGQRGLRKDWSPAGYIDAWRSFVLDCEEGYQWSIYEYENELGVRDVIEKVLTAPELSVYPELPIFAEGVAEIDDRFASLLRLGPSVLQDSAPWWHRSLPGYAGPDLVADAKSIYSVQLRLVDH
ncbi:hypothetical protein [Paenarthrobacter sp. 2TAF44]|uniref:hypothetical protein n=1 Tax=Paenarthrobacter sp. 2TAF44 TaxID=3233018 RepID=UPI003F9B42DC